MPLSVLSSTLHAYPYSAHRGPHCSTRLLIVLCTLYTWHCSYLTLLALLTCLLLPLVTRNETTNQGLLAIHPLYYNIMWRLCMMMSEARYQAWD